jgi:hypothetical protein
MRAKMVVSDVTTYRTNPNDPTSPIIGETLKMRAVCKADGYGADGKDEDNSYARWTPSADLTMYINNPELLGRFKPGVKMYVNFESVDNVPRALTPEELAANL